MKQFSLFAFLILLSCGSIAQNSRIEIGADFNYSSSTSESTYQELDTSYFEFVPFVSYNCNKNIQVGIGYMHLNEGANSEVETLDYSGLEPVFSTIQITSFEKKLSAVSFQIGVLSYPFSNKNLRFALYSRSYIGNYKLKQSYFNSYSNLHDSNVSSYLSNYSSARDVQVLGLMLQPEITYTFKYNIGISLKYSLCTYEIQKENSMTNKDFNADISPKKIFLGIRYSFWNRNSTNLSE